MTIWRFDDWGLVSAIMIVFAIIGFGRGVRRELLITFAILLVLVVLSWFEAPLVAMVNRLWRLVLFALLGGLTADNPGELFNERVRNRPPLIDTADTGDMFWFRLVFTALVLGFAYWLGRRVKVLATTPFRVVELFRVPTLLGRIVGAAAGAINGFLLVALIAPRIGMGTRQILVVPSQAITQMQDYWAFAAALALIAVIIIAGWSWGGGSARQDQG